MTVVLVHGMPQTYRLWNGVIGHLDRADEVIALDLPGFSSPAPAGWVAVKESYVEWIIAQLEPLVERDGPVHLVGHDWGCLLTLRVASLRPELLRSIAAGNGPIDEDWPLHAFWDRWNVPGEGERFMEEVLTPEVSVAMMKSIGLSDELAENNTWVVPGGKDVTLALYRSATHVGREWGPDLRRIVVPSMLLWGARDLIVPIEFGRRMATRMGAEVVALDAGHLAGRAPGGGGARAPAALGPRRVQSPDDPHAGCAGVSTGRGLRPGISSTQQAATSAPTAPIRNASSKPLSCGSPLASTWRGDHRARELGADRRADVAHDRVHAGGLAGLVRLDGVDDQVRDRRRRRRRRRR